MTDHNGSGVFFIGNATMLIRYHGFTVLTDPNFLHRGERAYLGYGLSSRRRTEPAAIPEDLAALDAVVPSPLHGDHFDRRARARLPRSVPIATTGPAERRLRKWGFTGATALDPWGSGTTPRGDERLRVTAVPGRHGPPL